MRLVRTSYLSATLLIIGCLFATLLLSAAHINAAASDSLDVTCSRTKVKGSASQTAPYTRVQVVLASDLSTVIATKVVTNHKGHFNASLNYPKQPANTLLVVSVGEWNGTAYLVPATLQSRGCDHKGGHVPSNSTPTPSFPLPTDIPGTPDPSIPTSIPEATPTPPAVPSSSVFVACDLTHVSGTITSGAPFVRVSITLASSLMQTLAEQTVPVDAMGSYFVSLNYAAQPLDTNLIISIGELDGATLLAPASLQGRLCDPNGGHVN